MPVTQLSGRHGLQPRCSDYKSRVFHLHMGKHLGEIKLRELHKWKKVLLQQTPVISLLVRAKLWWTLIIRPSWLYFLFVVLGEGSHCKF